MADRTEELARATLHAIRVQALVPDSGFFAIESSLPYGHIHAILSTIRALGLEDILASIPSRQRDLVPGTIIQCLIDPCSKFTTACSWHDTALAGELGVADAREENLYDALDWLLARQLFRCRYGAHLQELEQCRTGLPMSENG